MQEMTENEDMVKLMSISAKKRFENHFTGEIMGKRYAELYHSIL